ncbi:MAG TPA: S4 domain-containing protein, partial [Patescibacteria group bacterium]|nr:S4 domain-containing protein [Patescibacteria group bacterium]
MEITATPDNSGERLDKFLSGHYPDLSRSQVQKLIQEGRVQVEQEKKNSSYRLKQGDRVFSPSEQELKEQEAQSFQQQKQAAPEVDIVAETDDYVVVNKPAGLVSHRTPHLKEPALTD